MPSLIACLFHFHSVSFSPLSALFHTTTHTHPFNGPLSRTTRVSRYQKGKTNLDFAEARDSEWQWHQLDHMQVCTSLQTDNHASTPPLSFLQAGCPTSSVKSKYKSMQNCQLQNMTQNSYNEALPNCGFAFTASMNSTQSSHLTAANRIGWNRMLSGVQLNQTELFSFFGVSPLTSLYTHT